MRPYTQGLLDGMCGVYSVINAMHAIDHMPEKRAETMFRITIKKFSSIFPTAFYDGIKFDELLTITRWIAKKYVKNKLKCYKPVRKKVDIRGWFDILEQVLDKDKTAVIIGLGYPEDHWSVCVAVERKGNGRYLVLSDSYFGLKRFRESKFSMFKKKDKIQIDPFETIVIGK